MSGGHAAAHRAGMPQRVQLKRSAGWKMPPNTVKVDRTTRWGNPFTIAECGSAAIAVAQHGRWMRGEIAAPAASSRRPWKSCAPHLAVATSPAGVRSTARATPTCSCASPTRPEETASRRIDGNSQTRMLPSILAIPIANAPAAPPPMHRLLRHLAPLALVLLAAPFAQAQGVVNIYSARHYQTDEAFYANFTKETGIQINRIDGREDELSSGSRTKARAAPPTC